MKGAAGRRIIPETLRFGGTNENRTSPTNRLSKNPNTQLHQRGNTDNLEIQTSKPPLNQIHISNLKSEQFQSILHPLSSTRRGDSDKTEGIEEQLFQIEDEERSPIINQRNAFKRRTVSPEQNSRILPKTFSSPPTSNDQDDFKQSSSRVNSGTNLKTIRRNGLATSTEDNKEIYGRITFMNMQSALNSEKDFSHKSLSVVPLRANTDSLMQIFRDKNKKLSASWRFINILVLIQTFQNKLRSQCSSFKFSRLTDLHYRYIGDNTEVRSWVNAGSQDGKFSVWFDDISSISCLRDTLKRIKVFGPQENSVIFWKSMMLIMLVSQVLFIPIKIAFFNFELDIADILTFFLVQLPFIMCVCDILLNFNIAFFSTEGVAVFDRKGIVKNYMRFHFWLDLITTASLGIASLPITDLCFLLRLLQISEIINYLDECLQLSQRFNTVYTLVKLIATIITAAHIFGCGFYYMSFYDENLNWVESLHLDKPSWGTLYLKSIYFIIITMITVGFGDITPKNNAETIYILGIALLSCFQFGYTVNVIGSLFQEKAQQEAIIKAQKYQISTYMRSRSISNSVQMSVLKSLDYKQKQQIDSPAVGLNILEKVSKSLRSKVRFDFYWRILKDQQFLTHYFSEEFLKALTSVMSERTCIPGDFLYNLHDTQTTDLLYIIVKGRIDLTLTDCKPLNSSSKFLVLQRKAKDLFGHVSFFTGCPRETDSECAIASHIVYCSRSDFLSIAKNFPLDYEKFCLIKEQISLYQRDKDTKCIGCDKFGHYIIDCPSVHYSRFKSLVIRRHTFSTTQKRGLNNKIRNKKYNCLLHLEPIRLGLKKIRIKLLRQIQKQAAHQEDVSSSSSTDSSDLSDYVHEVNIENQAKRLRSQSHAFSALHPHDQDKLFFMRHQKLNPFNPHVLQNNSDGSSSSQQSEGESDGQTHRNNGNVHRKNKLKSDIGTPKHSNKSKPSTNLVEDTETAQEMPRNIPDSSRMITSLEYFSKNQVKDRRFSFHSSEDRLVNSNLSRLNSYSKSKLVTSEKNPTSKHIIASRVPHSSKKLSRRSKSGSEVSFEQVQSVVSRQIIQRKLTPLQSDDSIEQNMSDSDCQNKNSVSICVSKSSSKEARISIDRIPSNIKFTFQKNKTPDQKKNEFISRIASEKIMIGEQPSSEQDKERIIFIQNQLQSLSSPSISSTSSPVSKTRLHKPSFQEDQFQATNQFIKNDQSAISGQQRKPKSEYYNSFQNISLKQSERSHRLILGKEDTPKVRKLNLNPLSKLSKQESIDYQEEQQEKSYKSDVEYQNLNVDQSLNSSQDRIREEEFFTIPDFEVPKCYQVYFPLNNINVVVENLGKFLMKKYISGRIKQTIKISKSNPRGGGLIPQQPQQSRFQLANIVRKRFLQKRKKSN